MYRDRIRKLAKKLRPIPTSLEPGGSLGAPVECILFDVYGTLFISGTGDIGIARRSPADTEAVGSLLKKYRIKHSPTVLRSLLFTAIEKRHRILRKRGVDFPEVRIDHIWSSVLDFADMRQVRDFALEYEMIVNPVFPMPHMKEVFAHCRKKNLPMGIISNAQFYTPLLFQAFLGAEPADLGFHAGLLIYSFQHDHAKPSAVLYRMAKARLEDMGIPPAATLYVGNDMRKDIRPARREGFKTALFAGDARSLRLDADNPAGGAPLPDLVVTDLRQLLNHV